MEEGFFFLARDVDQGAWVGIQRGAMTDTVMQGALDGALELRAWSRQNKTRAAFLLVITDSSGPSAKQRAQFAEVMEHPDYNPYVAAISSSTFVRGAFTAIQWLQRKRHYEMKMFPSEAAGIAWLEEMRGSPIPRLPELLFEVQREAALTQVHSKSGT